MTTNHAPDLETVGLVVAERVATIRLNRPEVMNAWNGSLCRDLDAALTWVSESADVGAVVITGAGRAFCAGADLSSGPETFSREGGRNDQADDTAARTPKVLPWDVPKPVIAAINGAAVGVGATYALACDIRVAAPEAKIGFVFSRRGMLPELGSHSVLPRVVGFSNAADLLFSGRIVTGDEAADLGLVSEAVPGDQVVAAATERARDMAINGAPASMAISKRLLWESTGLDEMRAREEPLFAWVAEQADAVEGVASFLEKRPPQWNLSARDTPEDLLP